MQKILLAANAEADQPWVTDATAQLARETGARVAVLSVDELETERLATLPRSEYIRRAEEAASAAVERLRGAGIESTAEVRSGSALDQILSYAEEQEVDLIVLGSSTRGRLATAILGSVPISVIQRSQRPVLIVTEPMATS